MKSINMHFVIRTLSNADAEKSASSSQAGLHCGGRAWQNLKDKWLLYLKMETFTGPETDKSLFCLELLNRSMRSIPGHLERAAAEEVTG